MCRHREADLEVGIHAGWLQHQEGSLLTSVLDAGVSRCLGLGSVFRRASYLASQLLCLLFWEERLMEGSHPHSA